MLKVEYVDENIGRLKRRERLKYSKEVLLVTQTKLSIVLCLGSWLQLWVMRDIKVT